MAENFLRINHEGDSIQLSWQRGRAASRNAPPVTFAHPFDSKVLADLRWYLEEYLRFPYGLQPENAKKIEQQLQAWGQQLFDLVFRSSDKAREFFRKRRETDWIGAKLALLPTNPPYSICPGNCCLPQIINFSHLCWRGCIAVLATLQFGQNWAQCLTNN